MLTKKTVCFLLTALMLMLAAPVCAASSDVMIYEVYTSGGYSSGKNNAPYQNCYVVLYNSAAHDIDLGGWSLLYAQGNSESADADKTVNLSGIIGAGRFFVVQGGHCADPASPPVGNALPFTVNQNAPQLVMTRKTGKIALYRSTGAATISPSTAADFLGYGDAPSSTNAYEGSYPADGITVKKVLRREQARDTDDNSRDFKTVDIVDSPDKIIYYNDQTYTAAVSSVFFSHEAGYYSEAFALSLSTNLDGAQIYYTTDGSSPLLSDGSVSRSAIVYDDNAKIQIYFRENEPSNMMGIGGTTPDWQSDKRFIWPPVKNDGESDSDYQQRLTNLYTSTNKIHAIRAAAVSASGATPVSLSSYILNKEKIKKRYNLPVFSITTDKDSLYNPQTGIFMSENEQARGSEWERGAQIQFFEVDGSLQFTENIGLRLNGGYTRSYPQKALRVYFRENTLQYDIFRGTAVDSNGEAITRFNNFVLRSSGNDWYSAGIRDAFWQLYTAQFGTFSHQAYRPSIVFLNGEFWGIYDIRERYDENYFQRHFGVAEEDLAVVEGFSSLAEGVYGDQYPIRDLKEFIRTNDMSLAENYKRFTDEVDVDEYIDYMICSVYNGNKDWPHNNFKLWRNKNADNGMDTKWHPAMQDVDYGFSHSGGGPENDTLEWAMTDPENNVGDVLKGLMDNREFKRKFVNRFEYLMNNFFIADEMIEFLHELKDEVSTATAEHRARWNLDYGVWEKAYETIESTLKIRNNVMREAIIKNLGITPGITLSSALQAKLDGAVSLKAGMPYAIVDNAISAVDSADFSVTPTIIDGRTLVPARFITESLGGTVEWDGATGTGTCKVGGNVVVFTLGSNTMTVNGSTVTLDVPARSLSGRTQLPLRAFTESIGMSVYWESENKIIVISPSELSFSDSEIGELLTQLY